MPDRTDRSERAVLDAAAAIFARHGFVGTSIRALTEACGRSRSTLYGAYGDKAGLFVAALRWHVDGDPLGEDRPPHTPCLLTRSCFELADLPPAAVPIVQSALEARWATLRGRRGCSETEAVNALAAQLGRSVLVAAGVDPDLLDAGRDGEDSL